MIQRKFVSQWIILLAFWMTQASTAEDIVFAHGANPGNPRYVAAEKWAQLLEACSGGTHEVTVAASASLGDDEDMLTALLDGGIHVSANSQGAVSQHVPEVGLLGLPFLFDDLLLARKVLEGPVGEMLDARANEAGFTIIGYWDNGIRNITHRSRHVPEPFDVIGMKIRIPPDPVTRDIFTTLGAEPAPLAWSKLPAALESGQFDGQENPLANIYSAHLHRFNPFITLTGHKYESTPVIASVAWWHRLDDMTRACVSKATSDAGRLQRQMFLQADELLKPQMESDGAVFMEADRDAYRAAVAPVYDKYAKLYPHMLDALMEAAGH